MTARNFLIPTGIYDKVISILENPRVSDTRGQKLSRSARVFVIPVENTRGYTRGPGIPAQHWCVPEEPVSEESLEFVTSYEK